MLMRCCLALMEACQIAATLLLSFKHMFANMFVEKMQRAEILQESFIQHTLTYPFERLRRRIVCGFRVATSTMPW